MKSKGIMLVATLVLMLAGTQTAQAQRNANMSLTVTANNLGIFTCNVNVPSFDFGNVDADGTDFATPNVVANGRNGANTGGTYENAAGSLTWGCQAAPVSSVDITLTSIPSDHSVGSMPDDALEVRIPAAGGGASTGYNAFTSGNDLITGMSVGNAGSAVSGNLDLRLNVLDIDPVGANTWVVNLRATGTP